MSDHAALADLAHRHGADYVVDNTFASPYVCRPLEFGADLVVESATKFLGGHSDLIAGVVAGSAARIAEVERVQIETGATLGPLEAFLVLRGMLTLGVRGERHARNAAALAEWLERQDGVDRVLYPGLPSHPQHATRHAPVPARCRRRDAGVRGGRRSRRRAGAHRPPDAPRADRLARQRPHDGRPPAVDVAAPDDARPSCSRPGSAPACCASRSAWRTWRTSRRISRTRSPPPARSAPPRPRPPSRSPAIATRTAVPAAITRPAPSNPLARVGRGLWRLLTSVDFAVAQIIVLLVMALVGMTIKQLPDFAFRSAGDYAAAIDDIHARYDPVMGAALVDVLERLSVFSIFRSAWFSAALDAPRGLDRRLHARPDAQAVARRRGRAGRPARAVLRSRGSPTGPRCRASPPPTRGPSSGATISGSARRAAPTAPPSCTATATSTRSWRRCSRTPGWCCSWSRPR